MRMHPTGKATVITGSSPHGQGHATSWSQIMRAELGVPFDDVEVIHGDTAFAPYGLGTYGSRSLAVAGIALHRSIGKVKDKARLLAAHLLECSADDLEWSDDRWQVKGSPDRAKTIQELGAAAWTAASLPDGIEPVLEATTFHDPPNFTFPFGTHVCRGRDRPRDGPGRDRALHRGRRLRQRHQPDDRRRAGARRHRPVDRAGAVRGDGLRRGRAAAHADARRVRDAVGGRPAAHGARPHGDAVARPTRSASRASARPAPSRPAPRSSTPPSTRCRRSASATWRCRCSRRASGTPCASAVGGDR